MNLKRYFTIYAALWKNSAAREMSFYVPWRLIQAAWATICSFTLALAQTRGVNC